MDNPVIIIGANSLGKTALDIFTLNDILLYCFLDEAEDLHGTEVFDISVMGSPKDDGYLKYIGKKCDVFVASSDQKERKEWVDLLKKKRKTTPLNAIHPKTTISKYARVGEGNLIDAGTYIGADTQINQHVFIHSNVSIAADCFINDFVNIGANTSIGERVTVGENALIGAGSVIMAGVKIGEHAQVAPGSLVMGDVEDEQTVFGSPAKPV